MQFSELWVLWEKRVKKGAAFSAGYPDVPVQRVRRLGVVEVLVVWKKVQGNQSRGGYGSRRVLLAFDQCNHVSLRIEKG
jgi:hypothetical protein